MAQSKNDNDDSNSVRSEDDDSEEQCISCQDYITNGYCSRCCICDSFLHQDCLIKVYKDDSEVGICSLCLVKNILDIVEDPQSNTLTRMTRIWTFIWSQLLDYQKFDPEKFIKIVKNNVQQDSAPLIDYVKTCMVPVDEELNKDCATDEKSKRNSQLIQMVLNDSNGDDDIDEDTCYICNRKYNEENSKRCKFCKNTVDTECALDNTVCLHCWLRPLVLNFDEELLIEDAEDYPLRWITTLILNPKIYDAKHLMEIMCSYLNTIRSDGHAQKIIEQRNNLRRFFAESILSLKIRDEKKVEKSKEIKRKRDINENVIITKVKKLKN